MAALTYESIASATGNGSSGSITFSSIPSTYTDLQLVIWAQSTASTPNCAVTFNGDTGSNYGYTLYSASSGSTIQYGISQGGTYLYLTSGNNIGNTVPSMRTLDIFQYANTSFSKCLFSRETSTVNSSTAAASYQASNSLCWASTAAINSMNIYLLSNAFATTTIVSLYGIKAA